MREGLAGYRATGAAMAQSNNLAGLGEAHGQAGQAEAGLATVDEALAFVDRTEERFYEAELYRVKGVLTLQSLIESRKPVQKTVEGAKVEEEVEACFQKAIEIAQHQHSRSWELRAATSLARLWQGQGKVAEARELLAPVYDWFTEGFETADLQEAKALLNDLT